MTGIRFTVNGVALNDEFVGFPVTIGRMTELLGTPRETRTDDADYYTWDDHGILGVARTRFGFIHELRVHRAATPGRANVRPESAYVGEIGLNGRDLDLVHDFRAGWREDLRVHLLTPYYLLIMAADPDTVRLAVAKPGANYLGGVERNRPARPSPLERPFPEWRDAERPRHRVDLTEGALTIDGARVALAAPVEELTSILGLGRSVVSGTVERVVWDAMGIECVLDADRSIRSVTFYDRPDSLQPSLPRQPARLAVTVDGGPAADAVWTISAPVKRERESDSTSIMRVDGFGGAFWRISSLAPIPARGDYTLPVATEPVLEFADFNAKLLVVEALMYNLGLLTPEFEVRDWARWYTGREVDIEREGYAIIPEVREWFELLSVTASLAARVETLMFDGGNRVYGELYPFWDGEDDAFDVRDWSDLLQLPNLRRITLPRGMDRPGLAELEARGVELRRY